MSNPFEAGYILVAQANCRKQSQASVELCMYLNSAMKHYKYDGDYLSNTRRKSKKQRQRDYKIKSGSQSSRCDERIEENSFRRDEELIPESMFDTSPPPGDNSTGGGGGFVDGYSHFAAL